MVKSFTEVLRVLPVSVHRELFLRFQERRAHYGAVSEGYGVGKYFSLESVENSPIVMDTAL